MSILTMCLAEQAAEAALGPIYGAQLRKDTKRGRLARAGKSAAAMAVVKRLGDVQPGEWRYDSPRFAERWAELCAYAREVFEAEVAYLVHHDK
jgi:hypothetical protein